MNKIFKNENSFFGKIEKFFWACYSKEPLRFLFWGGINSLVTILNTYWIRAVFNACSWPIKAFENSTNEMLVIIGNKFDWPFIIAFIIGIPIAYTTHALFSFKQKWSIVRLLRYPLSSIPNFILQLFAIWLLEVVLSVNPYLTYLLAAIFPLPIMFFVNKFLVSPIKKKSETKE
jgi:putative flippase GtrA